ncbi:MAG: transposase [Chloroflexia bacterium]|nr:transposase [Chloroflexia bacterium]
MAGFERACQAKEIALYVLPPRGPKLNGRVERLNGTSRREFRECYNGDLDLPIVQATLREWKVTYNTIRPHQALGYDTRQAFLRSRKFLKCIEPGHWLASYGSLPYDAGTGFRTLSYPGRYAWPTTIPRRPATWCRSAPLCPRCPSGSPASTGRPDPSVTASMSSHRSCSLAVFSASLSRSWLYRRRTIRGKMVRSSTTSFALDSSSSARPTSPF